MMVGESAGQQHLPARLPGVAEILNRVGTVSPPSTFTSAPVSPPVSYRPAFYIPASQPVQGVYKPRHIVPRSVPTISQPSPPTVRVPAQVERPTTKHDKVLGLDTSTVQVRRYERENKNGPWLDTGLKHATEYEKLKMYTVSLASSQAAECLSVRVRTYEDGTPVDSRGVPATSQSRYLLSLNESFSDPQRELEFRLDPSNPTVTFYVKPHFVAVVPRKNYKRAIIEIGVVLRDGTYLVVGSNAAQIKSRKPQVRHRRNPRKDYVESRRTNRSRKTREVSYDSDDEEAAAYGLATARLRASS
mmetsp:Transcript_18744/g.72300  ORF Transcript_18744/g.72300 Transcript_18744/m.72300 type:complete len:302 (+) Transcript_18744:79-984(+)